MSAILLFSKEGSNIVGTLVELVDSRKQFSASLIVDDKKISIVSTPSESDLLYCTSCKVALQDRQNQLLHYRLDWHRVNLKRKAQGKHPLLAAAFEEITSESDVMVTYSFVHLSVDFYSTRTYIDWFRIPFSGLLMSHSQTLFLCNGEEAVQNYCFFLYA